MSNRNFDQGLAIGKRLIDITGSFVSLAGAGTVLASAVKGLGFGYAPLNGVMALQPTAKQGINGTPGIIRVSTGLYTITLDDSYRQVNYISADLWSPTIGGTANWVQPVNTMTNFGVSATAPSFQLLVVNSSGAPVDVAAVISFEIQLEDSTVQFQKP